MIKNAIKVRNLCKTIGRKKVLKDINFDVYEGQIVGLVGKNGSGKSTLIKVMTGIYKIDDGEILYYDTSVKKEFDKAMSMICTLIEMPHIHKNLNKKNNVELFKSMLKGVDENVVEEIVKIIEMEKSLGKDFKTYPAYIQNRLEKVSFKDNNKILILDEPIDGLNDYGVKKILSHLKNLKNTTVLISSNELKDIDELCDKIIFMNNGSIEGVKANTKKEKKKVIFEVDDYIKAKYLIKDYCIGENLEVYETDEKISQINKELIFNNINVYRIYEDNKILKGLLSIGDNND